MMAEAKGERANMRVKTEWFLTMLRQKQISQRKLAKEMGLDPAAVSLMLHGKRKIQLVEAGRMATIIGVQLNDVLMAAGIQSMPHREWGAVQDTLRRLMKHATTHAMECTKRGDMTGAKEAMGDVSNAMTLLDAMMSRPEVGTNAS